MKIWQFIATGLAVLAVTSALEVGPIRLVNNKRFINYTMGASPDNSLLECVHELEGDETLTKISWALWDAGKVVGTYDWPAEGTLAATGRLKGKVKLTRDDGSLELSQLQYDLSGEYSCNVTVSTGETGGAAKWEVLIVDSVPYLSTLHRNISGCNYITDFSTLAMYPEPVVRAGLYSDQIGGFYQEIPHSRWLVMRHENHSVTYSYSKFGFELDSKTPIDISFRVTVGIMKADDNYIPINTEIDEHIILHHLGCPEPRGAPYQHIEFHRDTITCRGEHQETVATVTCKEGFHADSEEDEVTITCDEPSRTWVLEDGRPAKREHLKCVIDGAPSTATVSAALLGAALVFQRFFYL